MATGTKSAFGNFFNIVATPADWNGFIRPSFERVPSGKITVDQFFSFMLVPNLAISIMDCRRSLRSIFAAPPYFRLKDMDGMPRVSSILDINLAWYLRRNQISGGI